MTGSNVNHGWRNPELGSDGRFYRGVGSPGSRRFANSHDQLRGIPVGTTDAGTRRPRLGPHSNREFRHAVMVEAVALYSLLTRG